MRLDPYHRKLKSGTSDEPDGSARRSVAPTRRGQMTPERCEAIRQRVQSGAYNTAGVIDEVARRLLDSGDLDR